MWSVSDSVLEEVAGWGGRCSARDIQDGKAWRAGGQAGMQLPYRIAVIEMPG